MWDGTERWWIMKDVSVILSERLAIGRWIEGYVLRLHVWFVCMCVESFCKIGGVLVGALQYCNVFYRTGILNARFGFTVQCTVLY